MLCPPNFLCGAKWGEKKICQCGNVWRVAYRGNGRCGPGFERDVTDGEQTLLALGLWPKSIRGSHRAAKYVALPEPKSQLLAAPWMKKCCRAVLGRSKELDLLTLVHSSGTKTQISKWVFETLLTLCQQERLKGPVFRPLQTDLRGLCRKKRACKLKSIFFSFKNKLKYCRNRLSLSINPIVSILDCFSQEIDICALFSWRYICRANRNDVSAYRFWCLYQSPHSSYVMIGASPAILPLMETIYSV